MYLHPNRRSFLAAALSSTVAWLSGCDSPRRERADTLPEPRDPPTGSRNERIDRSLSAAARYLVHQQSTDGAWRSELKGPFKDGGSLTPLAVYALHVAAVADSMSACHKGAAYLAKRAQPDGTIDAGPHGLSYPVYTAALAVRVLSEVTPDRHRPARDTWLTYLRARQLTEDLGWQPADKPYGGWGYCARVPRKPGPDEFAPPMLESNLSATRFALEALHAAGCPAGDAAFRKALVFLKRCQNYTDVAGERDPALDDGGFYFIYDDPVRNKAGVAGKDRSGRDRFHSYGSTSADGLRGLLLCGQARDDARVTAARTWLESNFSAAEHPGKYAVNRERDRPAVYYYYSWSAAQALRAAGVREVETKAGKVRWEEALADALLSRQQPDGSWVNDAEQVREDDPLVATPLAMAALAVCRRD